MKERAIFDNICSIYKQQTIHDCCILYHFRPELSHNPLQTLTSLFIIFSGDLVQAEDVMSLLRSFCSDATIDVLPRLDVLKVLEKVRFIIFIYMKTAQCNKQRSTQVYFWNIEGCLWKTLCTWAPKGSERDI